MGFVSKEELNKLKELVDSCPCNVCEKRKNCTTPLASKTSKPCKIWYSWYKDAWETSCTTVKKICSR